MIHQFDEYREDQKLNIDITNKCILACPKCPRQTDSSKEYRRGELWKRGHDITLENFEKIASYFNVCISFCGQLGDPIYHPQFLDILKICNKYKKRYNIHTNGFGKKEDWWDDAFFLTGEDAPAKFTWIFALDGLPEESHIYRVNQDGKKVFEIMCKGAQAGVDIFWQYIPFKYNQDHIEQAKQMAKDNGITFELLVSSRWNSGDEFKPTKKELYLDRPEETGWKTK